MSKSPCSGVQEVSEVDHKYLINRAFLVVPMRFFPVFSLRAGRKQVDTYPEGLAVGGVEAGERLGAGAELGLGEAVERRLDRVEEFVHVAGIGLDK